MRISPCSNAGQPPPSTALTAANPDPADQLDVLAEVLVNGADAMADTSTAASGTSAPSPIEALRALRAEAAASAPAREAVLGALSRRLAESNHARAPAWMLLAELSEQSGRPLQALRAWRQASLRAASNVEATALEVLGLRTQADWRAKVAAMSRLRAEYLQDAYADIRRAHEPKTLFRIDRALAGYLGQASVFSSHPTQRPKVMYVPGLRSGGFLDPASHPLVPALMAGYGAMKAEFIDVLTSGTGVEPFLGVGRSRTTDEYVSGPAGASWDALFFFRHGRRFEENHRRFPRTAALLDALDLCRIDGQAPEVCFSILRPHTRIEPHHGVTNARVVIHIPFLVPAGCFLELTGVGRHAWREGEPFVFDDTFEHAAENPSGTPRGILLMDAWHPELTPPERDAFRAIIEAITRMEASPAF